MGINYSHMKLFIISVHTKNDVLCCWRRMRPLRASNAKTNEQKIRCEYMHQDDREDEQKKIK
jgi:hypothetical protein